MKKFWLFLLLLCFVFTAEGQPGYYCESAIAIASGIHTIDKNNMVQQWYVYTATQNGIVTVSSCGLSTADTYVEVYNNCNGWIIASSDNACGNQSKVMFESKAGTKYYIRWQNRTDSVGFSWQIEERDYQPGDLCSIAIEVDTGTHTAQNTIGDQWFAYNAPQKGKLFIYNCGLTSEDSYLEIYTNCDSNLLTSNNNYCGTQSRVILNVEKGSYYIKWRKLLYDYSYTFPWRLQFSPANEIASVAQQNSLSLFPNPAYDQMTISLKTNGSLPTKIQLLTLNGQKVGEYIMKTSTLNVDVSSLSADMYILQTTYGQNVYRLKWIKQ